MTLSLRDRDGEEGHLHTWAALTMTPQALHRGSKVVPTASTVNPRNKGLPLAAPDGKGN